MTTTTTTTSSTVPDAARRERARQHFAWQKSVAERSDLSPIVRLAAWALARRRNVLSGRRDPSYADIAKGMGGMSERSAIRAVAALERAGLIVINRRVGRGHRNRLTFVMPEKVTQPCHGFAAEKSDKPGAGRPPDAARKGDRPDLEKVTEQRHPNMERAPTEPSQHGEERDARARDPHIFARRCRAAKIERDARADQPAAVEPEIIGPTAGGFADLRAIFNRGWVEDHALAAQRYAAARREVGHDAIEEGARRWAKVYVADNGGLRFLPPLDRWLEERAWEMAPPSRKARSDASGARKPFGKPNLRLIAQAYAARLTAAREARI
jgi:hypothetical protein